jgi:hypothetical protein
MVLHFPLRVLPSLQLNILKCKTYLKSRFVVVGIFYTGKNRVVKIVCSSFKVVFL